MYKSERCLLHPLPGHRRPTLLPGCPPPPTGCPLYVHPSVQCAHDLDQPIPITYRRDDHTEQSLPPSAETGWEMMLCSFSSMQTMAQKHSEELANFQQEGNCSPQLHIFVVGTFRDQLVEEGSTRYQQAPQKVGEKAILSLHPERFKRAAILFHQQHGRQGGQKSLCQQPS